MSGAAAIIADRSPFGAPLQCFSARAALPGITGCKREDPLRHQCSEHLAVRTRAGRDDAQAAREHGVSPQPTRTAPAPPQGVPSRKASFVEGDDPSLDGYRELL